ncbi:MAG: glycosyltransferase [Armatimonadetes bacterium]|nr:glycosyltransferase [Armatimonadota bacterium]
MRTYWKDAEHVVDPPERLTPPVLIDLQNAQHVHIREYAGPRQLTLSPSFGVLHHLSYAGSDERIKRKIGTWSHRHELVDRWYERVWKGWAGDPLLTDVHPTHPAAYKTIIATKLHPDLEEAGIVPTPAPAFDLPAIWPKISVIIPVYGGQDDLDDCLRSLKDCAGLFSELIVVDDASPEPVSATSATQLIRRETNGGFAAACNTGIKASTGEVVVILNSDTCVPRAGFYRLIETLMTSGSIGAAGPISNYAGYHQYLGRDLAADESMELLSVDLAESSRHDRDVEMLVGFCVAIRRAVLDEVGLFDEDFGRGFFEDTDLSYRILRAGYRLRLANRAFIYHKGSKTFARERISAQSLLSVNQAKYRKKWQDDLESGFASHLSGEDPSPIVFREDRRPDVITRELRRLCERAEVSICMIVRNEERVIGDCLSSVAPYFSDIVVVDTGSTDQTVEIAKSFGARVSEIVWPDSFAEARNESLRLANGRWIFWIDADDTIPLATAEAVIRAASSASPETAGFVIPVQFVDGEIGQGTRVDHVKLFRNLPGVQFEGRIHEQILSSLRPHGEIARLEGAVVLHTGYDTSQTGQAKKRERDWHLLELDLNDRPNHPFVLFNIGMTHRFTGEHVQAIEALDRCLSVSGPHESHVRKAFVLRGNSLRAMGRREEALETFQRGFELAPDDPELRFLQGLTQMELGRPLEAIHAYETMPVDASGFFSSFDVGILGPKRNFNLAAAYWAAGNYVKARELWRQCNWKEAAEVFFDAALQVGDLEHASGALKVINQESGLGIEWAERLVRFHETLNGREAQDTDLIQLLQSNPGSWGLTLIWARRLCRTGRSSMAMEHLVELASGGVAEAAYYLALISLELNKPEEAQQWALRTLELDPGSPQANEVLRRIAEPSSDSSEPSPCTSEPNDNDVEIV